MQSNLRKLSRVVPCTDKSTSRSLRQITHLAEIPVESRLLLGILRMASYQGELPSPEAQVLDALGRILDPSEDRIRTLGHLQTLNQCVLAKTKRELEIRNHPAQMLSDDEHVIMNNLSSLAQGQPNDIELDALMNETAQHLFRTASRYVLTKPSMDGLYRTDNKRWPTDDHNEGMQPNVQLLQQDTHILGSVLKCKDLSFHETAIVTIVRLWVRGIATQYNSDLAVNLLCAHLSLPRLGQAMLTILRQTATSAHRQMDIRCICCPELSPDEARILSAMSALLHNRIREYQKHLSDWLPREQAQPAYLLSLSEFLTHKQPHTVLPLRNWDFKLLRARQPLFELGAPDAHQTYH